MAVRDSELSTIWNCDSPRKPKVSKSEDNIIKKNYKVQQN